MKESSLESDEVKRDRTVQNSKGNSMAVAMSTRQVPIPIRSDRALQEVTSGGTGHQHQTSQHIPAAAPMSMPLPRQSTAGKSSDSSLEEEESQISRGVPRTGQAGGLPPVKKSGAPKKDRSKLRKGKWTVEEEEYTSRIIHYFSTGLLTLPEGATLRSYLADKLNCDPMRITKKYAGASCLGRRVYHFRDRAQPTIAEIHLAKAELDHLEQRFRMRVEEGHSGIPLPPHPNMMMSMQQNTQILAPNSASQGIAFQSWLMGLAATTTSGAPAATTMAGPLQSAPSPAALWPMAAAASPGQWLLPSTSSPAVGSLAMPPTAPPDPSIQAVNDAMANWAFAQAAASFAPAISHLAVANLQQQQQQQQQQIYQAKSKGEASANALQLKESYEAIAVANLQQQMYQVQSQDEAKAVVNLQQQQQQMYQAKSHDEAKSNALQLKESYEAVAAAKLQQQKQQIYQAKSQDEAKSNALQLKESYEAKANALKSQDEAKAKALQLKENYEAKANALKLKENYERYLKTQAIEMDRRMAENVATREPVAHEEPRVAPTTKDAKVEQPAAESQKRSSTARPGAAKKTRTEEDNAAGTILLGFLSSLRQSYEDALVGKQKLSNINGPIMTSRKSVETSSSSADSIGSGGCDGPADFFKQKRHAVPVTDASSGTSQQVESSVDDSDWNSDKKTDPSSSEDSDKEVNRHYSKGPPRKRMKTKKLADERRAS